MIHVLNPYKLSISMFRMAIYTWETQMNALKLFTHVAATANPVALTHDAAQQAETPKPAAKPRAATVSAKARAAKSTVAKTTTAKADVAPPEPEEKRYREPATPPTMPDQKPIQ